MKIFTTGFATGILFLLSAVIPAPAETFTNLHIFVNGSGDGTFPNGVTLNNGSLYGATAQGGSLSSGMVFILGTNGAGFTSLHDFAGAPSDGSSPNELLVAGDTIYGTTYVGGSNSSGTIFRMGTNGANYTVLRNFTNSPDPQFSLAGLVLGGATLYGTSLNGGSNGLGTVFKIDTNGANFTVLHHFANSPDGANPRSRLLLNDATLYGTAGSGGTNGGGIAFKLDTNGGGYSVIYNFSNSPLAATPYVGLTLGGSTLYGVSASGGSSNAGAVFSLGTNGAGFALLHSFTNNEGLSPQSTLALNNGKLYGATLSRGTGGNGTVFQLSTNGANFTVLKNFTNLLTGANPKGPITLDANTIFGVANAGGPSSGGTVFRLQLAPVITAPPQDLAVTNGNPASFIVNAVSDSAMTYQWYFNASSPLAGQTGSSLNLASVSGIDAGAYTVVVSDFTGSVTSSPASLTVFSPPNITAQPQSLTVTNGNPATFNVTATNGVLSYQWYFNTNNLLVGQTNNSLNIAVTTTNDAGKYSVVVANNIGSTTSSPASLTVVASQPPSITAQPQNLSITNGDTAVFTVAAINGTLTYQWYFNTNSLLAGQTNNSLSIVVATTNNAGTYSVVVANNIGSITSSPARLTVSTNSRPFIITPPPNLYVTNGDTAKFSAVVTGKGPLPYITQSPTNLVITNGNIATFVAAAAGGGTLSYQWLFNTNTSIAGATATNLVITNANQPGAYSMKVTNNFGAATSSPAILTVVSKPIMLSSAFDAASGSYSFNFVNVAGSTNRLWATTNLANASAWQAIATNIMATNGSWQFTDSHTAQTNDLRLYRFSTP